MKQVKYLFVIILPAVCLVTSNTWSQTSVPGNSPVVFEGSTPCDDVSKRMLNIPPGTACELMTWTVRLYRHPKTSAPSTYKLICIYGVPKQGTRGFMQGAKQIELEDKWTIGKGTNQNPDAIVYKLAADNFSLSFLQAGQNLLHLLDKENGLMVGNGAWSYTLNRINPTTVSSTKITATAMSTPRIAGSPTVGIFEGRTPCGSNLRELNEISSDGCQIIKCKLILHKDAKTHAPTTFQIQTIYVGKGDTRYTNTGKWTMVKGTKYHPEDIVYQLKPDSPQVRGALAFLKADDNILLFLDKDGNLEVGNGYSSYTLSRAKIKE